MIDLTKVQDLYFFKLVLPLIRSFPLFSFFLHVFMDFKPWFWSVFNFFLPKPNLRVELYKILIMCGNHWLKTLFSFHDLIETYNNIVCYCAWTVVCYCARTVDTKTRSHKLLLLQWLTMLHYNMGTYGIYMVYRVGQTVITEVRFQSSARNFYYDFKNSYKGY